jgi:hypothetical protein
MLYTEASHYAWYAGTVDCAAHVHAHGIHEDLGENHSLLAETPVLRVGNIVGIVPIDKYRAIVKSLGFDGATGTALHGC